MVPATRVVLSEEELDDLVAATVILTRTGTEAGCVQLWLRTTEPIRDMSYKNWITTTTTIPDHRCEEAGGLIILRLCMSILKTY